MGLSSAADFTRFVSKPSEAATKSAKVPCQTRSSCSKVVDRYIFSKSVYKFSSGSDWNDIIERTQLKVP